MSKVPSFKSIQKLVSDSVPMGLSEAQIVAIFARNNQDLDPQDLVTANAYIKQAISEHESYEEIQAIINGTLLAPHDRKDCYYLLDKVKHTKRELKMSLVHRLISPKVDLKMRTVPCYFDYRPFVNSEIFKENGQTNYNSYEPPFWLKPSFYSNAALPVVNEIPEIYKRLLVHLFAGDEKSIEYTIKWIANSLKDRNRCYLATIAAQGVGKGVLGKILGALHGTSNYTEIEWGKSKDKRFNSVFANKRIIYIDEIDIKTRAQEDMIKNFTNDSMEVEYKGVDSKTAANFASLYLSSNHLDSLRLSADDRRFSIVEMTDVKLRDAFTAAEIGEMHEESNIAQLGYYLMGIKLDAQEMLSPFVSARTAMVREASVTDMEDYIINEYCKTYAGKDVLLEELQNHLSEKFGGKFRPSAAYLMSLSQKMPGHYKVHRPHVEDGARPRKIKIEELKNQPPTNYDLTK